MEIKLKPKKARTAKNVYIVTVVTMEGDADDYHSFKLKAKTIEELRELIIGLTILCAAYPNGQGGFDTYCGEFYEKYVSEKLFSYEGMDDSIESFSVEYINEDGEKFDVEYEMDDEMKNRINSYDGLTEDEIVEMEFDTNQCII